MCSAKRHAPCQRNLEIDQAEPSALVAQQQGHVHDQTDRQ